MAIISRRIASLTYRFSSGVSSSSSSSSFSSSTASKVPLLYTFNKNDTNSTDQAHQNDSASCTLELLSWGRGASGQLGGGIEEIRLYPSPVANLVLPKYSFVLSPTSGRLPTPTAAVVGDDSRSCGGDEDGMKNKKGKKLVEVGISCGLFHSSLVIDGALWIWGKGDGGRLGFGHENPLFVPALNPHVDDVRCAALGGLHSVALTSAGEVFTWGYGGFGALGHSVYHRELFPRLIKGSWEGTIQHIATSGTHTAAVTESGELYIWGRDEGDGRLGLGPGRGPDHAGGMSTPSKVKGLPLPIAAVSCGGFFTMALTVDGQLWNWGANSNYELGRGDKIGGWKPKPIPSLENVRIIQIASGGYHSLALTDDGKVLSWGHGGHGQLGHGSLQNQKIPKVVDALAHDRIVYISCGGSSSAAVTGTGKLYMWGNGNDSQLGVPGLPKVQPTPVEVNFLTEDDGLGPHKVLSIASGASHAMCLALRESS